MKMSTPPRSQLPATAFPPSRPKRPHLRQAISPPRLRPLEDLDDSYCKELELQRERIRKQEMEKEMRQDILRQVRLMNSENWLLRGPARFKGNIPNL